VHTNNGGCTPAWGAESSYSCLKEWTPVPNAPALFEIQGRCGIDDTASMTCWSGKAWTSTPLTTGGWPEVADPQPSSKTDRGVRALRNQFAILGDGTLIDTKTKRPVLADVKDACGTTLDTACALSASGTVSCWGEDALAFASPSKEPIPIGEGYVGIDCGLGTGCAIRSNGSLECWGYGIGDEPCGYQGSGRCASSPRTIEGLVGVRQVVVAGLGQFLTLRDDGSVAQFDPTKRITTVHPTK
jgi:hypothetical protein